MGDVFGTDEWAASDGGSDVRGMDELFEPEIRRTFRAVAIDWFRDGTMPVQAALLFGPEFGPWGSEREFLGELYNEIHHQDTCDRNTADGVRLLAALAIDQRVPPRERMDLVRALFLIATEADRHTAQYWPGRHPQADPAAATRARAAVEAQLADILADWNTECLGVRLALAALTTAYPASPAGAVVLPKIRALAQARRKDAPIAGYLRFVLLLADGTDDQVLAKIESLTESYWRATHREVPVIARGVHLLDRMLVQLRTMLLAWRG